MASIGVSPDFAIGAFPVPRTILTSGEEASFLNDTLLPVVGDNGRTVFKPAGAIAEGNHVVATNGEHIEVTCAFFFRSLSATGWMEILSIVSTKSLPTCKAQRLTVCRLRLRHWSQIVTANFPEVTSVFRHSVEAIFRLQTGDTTMLVTASHRIVVPHPSGWPGLGYFLRSCLADHSHQLERYEVLCC